MIRKSILLGTSMLVAAAIAAPAMAQQDEIVITATKREQTLQDVPIAVSVVSSDTIEKASIQDIGDLQSIVPSLRVTQLQSSTNTNFVIRGFGNGANNPGIEPSVGVFIDGVYRSRSASQIGDLLDIQRVEVLRGPQSTLFGKNASAGVISVVTAKPSFEWGGFAEATLGNYDTRILKGRVTGPLGDNLAFSLAGSVRQADGYFEVINLNENINNRDRWDVRAQLLFEPTDNFSVRIIADQSKIDEECCGVANLVNGPTGAIITALGGNIYTGDPFDRRNYLNYLPNNAVKNKGYSGHVDWEFENFSLTSITAYRKQSAAFDYDTDFTSAALIAENSANQNIDTFTQEFRITSNGGGMVDWLVGGFYFDETVKYDNSLTYDVAFRPYADQLVAALGAPGALGGLEASLGLPGGTFFGAGQGGFEQTGQDNQSYNIFANTDWHLSDRLTATIGIAYVNDEKDVFINQTNTDVFSSLDLVQIGFGGAFFAITGLPATPANIAANPAAAAAADGLSITECSPSNPPPACNSALGLRPLQFLAPLVPFNSSSSDNKTTYTARLAYDMTDSINVYASYATGYKATSWNLSRDSKPTPAEIPNLTPTVLGNPNPFARYGTRLAGPEDAEVFEIGLKGQWDNFALNVAWFDQTIKGFQSNVFTGTGFNLANAGEQSTKGLEVDARWTPSPSLEFTFAGTFLDPIYDSFVGAAGPSGPVDLSGQRPAGIHETSISTGATWLWEKNGYDGFVRADYLYESDVQLVENVPSSIASRQVGTLNASAGFSKDDWDFMVWGRNLNDDEYLMSGFPTVAQQGSFSGYPNMPRTYGVTMRKSW